MNIHTETKKAVHWRSDMEKGSLKEEDIEKEGDGTETVRVDQRSSEWEMTACHQLIVRLESEDLFEGFT